MKDKYLLLIDGSSLLSTQYYGNLPREILFAKTDEEKKKYYHKIMQTRKGVYTNAIYGFMRTLIKIIKEQKPDYLAVAWDMSRNTFRREIYADYKGNRGETPEPLKQQFKNCEDILAAMKIPQFMSDYYEADDFCGSLAAKFEKELPVRILTKDNDYLQLVTERTNLWLMHAKQEKTDELNKKYGIVPDGSIPDRVFNLTPELVKAEFGVEPASINSLKGLQGDSSDNIKGVPGIGPATAVALIAKYKNVRALYDDIRDLDEKQQKEKMKQWKEEMGISRSPFGFLLKKSDEELVGEEAALLSEQLATIKRDIDLKDTTLESLALRFDRTAANQKFEELEFRSLSVSDEEEKDEFSSAVYESTSDMNEFIALTELAAKKKKVGIAVAAAEMKNSGAGARIFGVAVSLAEKTVYVRAEGFVTSELIAERICWLIGQGTELAVMDLKKLMKCLQTDEAGNCFDCSIAAYLLDPLSGKYEYETVAEHILGNRPKSQAELLGKMSLEEAEGLSPDNLIRMVSLEARTAYLCCDKMKAALKEGGMERLYYEIELPLVPVLCGMEREGVTVLKDELARFGVALSADIDRLSKEIYEACGEEFNINSPKQLGVILFEKLRLPLDKKNKTKTGYSTSAEVLEKLKTEDPVIEKILDYRQLTKLKSTYADGLADYIEADGRIHTSFNQTVTATGRLSSTEPNLQNIPIRTELGRDLRKVFVPKEGYCFIDADYSQIELRILAAMSGDEKLIGAYKNSEDIHRATAAAVFGVPLEKVTKELRSRAKAVNFGIVYGISAFGLGEGLKISKAEADSYIKSYFETYPGVKSYLEGLVDSARSNQFSVTLFGRRRPIPELESANFMQRQFGERIAMNSPVQGTAADIIKIAMLRVAGRLKAEGLESKLLLQIHDELLVEARNDEADRVAELMAEEMKNAAELAVSLEVEVEMGSSWYEAH